MGGMPTKGNSRFGCGRLYDVNGKKLYVYRYPDLSFTPEALGLFIVFLIGFLILDFFHLSYGGIASEEQLRMGSYVRSEFRMGPSKDYYSEAVELVKKEVYRRDERVKPSDIIFIERHPEDTPYLFGLSRTQKAGYAGSGTFRVCFNYLVSRNEKTEMVYGTAMIKIEQTPISVFVRQIWKITSFDITTRETARARYAQ